MSGKNPLFKSGKTIWLWWDFCRSRISAGPKSGTALVLRGFTANYNQLLKPIVPYYSNTIGRT